MDVDPSSSEHVLRARVVVIDGLQLKNQQREDACEQCVCALVLSPLFCPLDLDEEIDRIHTRHNAIGASSETI